MQLAVFSVINRYTISARVLETNALLRFRFERPLNLDYVQPGRAITVHECFFNRKTHTIHCKRVAEPELLLAVPPTRPCFA